MTWHKYIALLGNYRFYLFLFVIVTCILMIAGLQMDNHTLCCFMVLIAVASISI
jgi:hypothetical protein